MIYQGTILRLIWLCIFIFIVKSVTLFSQKVNTSPSEIFDRKIDLGDRFLQIKYSKGLHYFKSNNVNYTFNPVEMNSFSFLTQLSPYYKLALGSTFSHGNYFNSSFISYEDFQGKETFIKLASNASYLSLNVDLIYFFNDFQYSFRPFMSLSTGMDGFYTRTRTFNSHRSRFRKFDSFHSNRNLGLNATFIGGFQLDLFENHASAEFSIGYRISSRNEANIPGSNFSQSMLGNPEIIYDQISLNKNSYYFNIAFLLNILSTSIE